MLIAKSFYFLDIAEILLFLLAMTFMLLIARNQADAANIELWGIPQMNRTTFCAL